ncbi:MAG TPA: carbohydrate ABC transporter permease [Ruminiclostridium sp.]
MNEKKHQITINVISVALWALAIIYIYPIILILFSAFKTQADMAINPFGLPKVISYDNFINAFQVMHYFRSLSNTIIIVLFAVSISTVFTAMAAYAIARKNNKFYNKIYLLYLGGLIIPFQMAMIPLYKILNAFNLISTYQGVIFVYLGILSPFAVFLFSGFVKSVPKELEEAALIDGCGIYKTFFLIVFPLLKPAISTIAVLNIFGVWNDFLMPMLYLQRRNLMTLTVQMSSFQGQYVTRWPLVFAGIFLIIGPMIIIYMFAQRFIVSGITAGAVKG